MGIGYNKTNTKNQPFEFLIPANGVKDHAFLHKSVFSFCFPAERRGECKRCKPFVCMRFDSPKHALEILMSKVEMIPYMQKGYLSIEGAPEFGNELSAQLFTVAYYAQGTYLDDQKKQ